MSVRKELHCIKPAARPLPAQSEAVANFYDPEEIKSVHYLEVEHLLKDKLGASRIFVFDHNVRNATREGLAKPLQLRIARRALCGEALSRGQSRRRCPRRAGAGG